MSNEQHKIGRLLVLRDATGHITKECCDQFRVLIEQQLEAAHDIFMARFSSLPKSSESRKIKVNLSVEVFEEQ